MIIKTGVLATEWVTDSSDGRWDVAYGQIGVSALSTQYVLVPVSASKAGSAFNPTSDTVQFAFMPTPTQVPATADWVTGSWETVSTSVLYPYNAKCLIGPSGATALTLGNYTIYLKITDSPEIPVMVAGTLAIS